MMRLELVDLLTALIPAPRIAAWQVRAARTARLKIPATCDESTENAKHPRNIAEIQSSLRVLTSAEATAPPARRSSPRQLTLKIPTILYEQSRELKHRNRAEELIADRRSTTRNNRVRQEIIESGIDE